MSGNDMSGNDEFAFVYATFPDLACAEKIGGDLIALHLAACVNILPGMTCLYRWQGAIERGSEVVAIFKTRKVCVDALIAEGVRQHPYETPAFVVIAVTGGAPGFLDWLSAETTSAG